MGSEKGIQESRRNFLKGAGVASAAYLMGAVSLVGAEAEKDEAVLAEHWAGKQKEYEAVEDQARKEYKPFDTLVSVSPSLEPQAAASIGKAENSRTNTHYERIVSIFRFPYLCQNNP